MISKVPSNSAPPCHFVVAPAICPERDSLKPFLALDISAVVAVLIFSENHIRFIKTCCLLPSPQSPGKEQSLNILNKWNMPAGTPTILQRIVVPPAGKSDKIFPILLSRVLLMSLSLTLFLKKKKTNKLPYGIWNKEMFVHFSSSFPALEIVHAIKCVGAPAHLGGVKKLKP